MKPLSFLILATFAFAGCSGQEKVSQKKFDEITLVNKIEFFDPKHSQERFSCGFLLQHDSDTFAVTAKHLLKIIKPDKMKTLSFDNQIRSWSMYPLNNKAEVVVTDSVLNENPSELLEDKATYNEDWLLFSVRRNASKVKVLKARQTALVRGEKLYVIGWTRNIETGPQRVYEFEYYKTIGKRHLLKDVVVPEKFGGLSGAPVVDDQGLLVGIVSGSTEDPVTGKKYFSPCSIEGLITQIERRQNQ